MAQLLSLAVAGPFFAAMGCSGPGTNLDALLDASAFAETSTSDADSGDAASLDPFGGAPAYVRMTPDAGTDLGAAAAHNQGSSCLQSACHAPGGMGMTLLLGGTLYDDYYGTTAVKAGVEVRIRDFSGHAISVYTDATGNFFVRAADANGLTFPAVVGVRDGASTRDMITTLSSATMGSCSESPCHVKGGSPSTGAYYPLHIP